MKFMSSEGYTLKEIKIILIVAGISMFFHRPFFIACSKSTDECKVYQNFDAVQKFKYSDIETCSAEDYTYTYRTYADYERERRYRLRKRNSIMRSINNKAYEPQKHEVTKFYPYILFKENTRYKYKNIDMKKAQGSFMGTEKICEEINAKKDFKIKCDKHVHDLFSYWYVPLIAGIVLLFI